MVVATANTQIPLPAGSLYQGLKAIWDTEFPKTCPKCGRVYHSFEEYLVDTIALPHSSGLMGYDIGDPGQQVGLFRNCACGTTIMAFCHDRRDLSESGNKRRELFGELMNRLVEAGISAMDARQKLLSALRTTPDVDEFRKAVQLPPQ
ncbi:MAG: oxidoreductase [Terrimicrobiaceae bacterium]